MKEKAKEELMMAEACLVEAYYLYPADEVLKAIRAVQEAIEEL